MNAPLCPIDVQISYSRSYVPGQGGIGILHGKEKLNGGRMAEAKQDANSCMDATGMDDLRSAALQDPCGY